MLHKSTLAIKLTDSMMAEFLVPMETNHQFMIPTISLSTPKWTADYREYCCILSTYNTHASFVMVPSYFSEFSDLNSTFQYH